MKIKEFILKNEVVVKNWLVDKNIVDEDDAKDLEFVDGDYSYEGLSNAKEICSVKDYGVDFSFERKFVEATYEEDINYALIIDGKKVYVLINII
jgi:hypothetical protein